MREYLGNEMQMYFVQESRLVGGKADGVRILRVKNGKGLEFTINLDRCADVVELSVKGDNFSFIAPCGYVAPQFYDKLDTGFLRSFTAGFLTTCGFNNAGGSCVDNGVTVPMHGNISNVPAERYNWFIKDNEIHIVAYVREAAIFNDKLLLEREYVISLEENVIKINDTVKNFGFDEAPLMMLYHCNFGYPLLTEESVLSIPSDNVWARTEHAKSGIATWNIVEKPQNGYEEMCFYHSFPEDEVVIGLYNPNINRGMEMSYNKNELPFFTQWKMMGQCEYVMGLEPGNCPPCGRANMRESGQLEFIAPQGEKKHHLTFKFK